METIKNPNISFHIMSAFGATIVTLIVFMFISTLTKIEKPTHSITNHPQILINNTHRSKLPEPVELDDKRPMLLDQVKNIVQNTKSANPREITPSNLMPRIDYPVGVAIKGIPIVKGVQVPVIPRTFSPLQVDRRPYIIKYVDPIYPFDAKSSGIEGRVVLRFVVDEKGFVLDPEVLNAEPEGVFEKSALLAIVKYKFKPAAIGNEPVRCIVVLPIGFKLNE